MLFIPDPRNAHKQKYCSKADCRTASKAASQAKWRKSEKGRDYFRGQVNVQRVQQWRKSHPGYWQRTHSEESDALQDHSTPKNSRKQPLTEDFQYSALQDLLTEQVPVLVGLIANLTGTALQDNIVVTTRRLQQLGLDVLNPSPVTSGGDNDQQTPYSPRPDPPDTTTIQLGGRPPGA
jgi:hypothetical protein